MEYAANGSVYQYIKKERSSVSEWNATKKLICIFGVASAMQYLHSHRILHRDLKSENILLTKDFLPKLSDFGLVKPIHLNESSITPQSNEFMAKGTWIYFAPETF